MGLDQRAAMKRALFAASLILAACGGRRDMDLAATAGRSDRLVWEAADRAFGKKRWMEAREHLRRIVDGFPNSEYAPLARLRLADTYFQDGGTANYVLAASEYRQFLTLFPSHAQSDYATFQVAECFFKQRHGPDRDQTPTLEALEEYQKVVDHHGDSPYAEKARVRIKECRQGLARSEYLVGLFYQRTRKAYRSAWGRYERVLNEYPEYLHADEVLFRLAECFVAGGRAKDASPPLDRLIKEFPQSPYAERAREMLTKLPPPTQDAVSTPTPSAAPPPAGS
jgi:outer membrane protein assembly factor BamD